MLKSCPTSASSVSSGAKSRMIQSIKNGKPTTNARSNNTGSERSCATKGLKYKDMLGDGDLSTYSAILESNPIERTVYEQTRMYWACPEATRKQTAEAKEFQ